MKLNDAGLPMLDQMLKRVRWNVAQHYHKSPDLPMLLGEISELAYAIAGRHEHDPEIELMQIAGICVNWLMQLQNRREVNDPTTPWRWPPDGREVL